MRDKQGFFSDLYESVKSKFKRSADKPLYNSYGQMTSLNSIAFDDNARVDVRQNLKTNVEWIATLCHTNSYYVASATDSYKLQLVKGRRKRTDIENHYIYDLFDNDTELSFYDFMYLGEYANQLIDGIPFYVQLKVVMGKEIPLKITPLYPDMGMLTANRDSFGRIAGYEWQGGSKMFSLKENEIMWYRLPNIGNSAGGGGWVNTSLRLANLDKYQKQHNLDTVINRGIPPGVVKFSDTLEKDNFDAAMKKYNESWRNAAKRQKLFGLDGGTIFEALGFSNVELDLINGMNLTRDYLHAQAGVPLLLTGHNDQTTFASARVVEALYKKGTVNKSLIGWEQFLNRAFCQKYFKQDSGGAKIEFVFDKTVPQDDESIQRIREIRLATGQATPNDFLVEDGKPISDEPSMSKYYLRAGYVPIDEVSLPPIDFNQTQQAQQE